MKNLKTVNARTEIIYPDSIDDTVRNDIYQRIESAGRTCYKSEDKITNESGEKFVRSLIKRGHLSPLEHATISVRFIVDRGISHEIVRHRIASYSQESTRYCVAGNTVLKTSNAHNTTTVGELYENVQHSKNGAWKRMRFKQYNEEKGVLQFAHVKNVFEVGEKECLSVKTKLGYEITCTPDHEILTPEGYVKAGGLGIGSMIYVNGTSELYMNRDWMYFQNITLNKTFKEIAEDFGFNISTIKKWARKLGIPKKGTGYFNVGRIPWNKGKQDIRQVEALRKYHHCGRRYDKILKDDTVKYQKHKGSQCAVCGSNESLEVHHVDKNRSNNKPSNLITLCESCHQRVHAKNLLTAYTDEVVEVKGAGVKTVYDIEMDSEYHNFVANGVIVHNCNYSKDKFDNKITFISPYEDYIEEIKDIDKLGQALRIWEKACAESQDRYMELIELGVSPQLARGVLNHSVKTELVATMNLREWREVFRQRCAKSAHPQMQDVMVPLYYKMLKLLPAVFDDMEEHITD